MSSDEDYFPSDGSYGLRRSKRVTRADVRKPEEKKLRKSLDRAEKKSAAARNKKKRSKSEKQKTQEAPKERESCKFSGEALTPAELQQLWIKFTQDGHFRCGPSMPSSSRPAVARQSEDARGNGKRKRSDAKRATVTSERASREDNVERTVTTSDKQDLLSVTMSNPLPNASGSTLHISASRGQCAAAFPSERHKSWAGPIICRNFVTSGSYRSGNSIDLSSNESAFSLVARKPHQRAPIANTRKPAFTEANSSGAWKSYEKPNEQSNNRSDANSRGYYCHGANSQMGHSDNSTIAQTDRANRDNLGNNCSNGTKLPPLQVRPNNLCGNFDQTGSAPGFQSGQTSMGNSSFVLPNQGSYGNANWNEMIDLNIPNIFPNDNPSMNDGFDLQNSIDHATSGFRPYNPEIQGSSMCSQGFGDNVNSMLDYGNKLNGHHLSLMAWNSLQVYQSPYSTGNEFSYLNNYNCSIPYDPSMIVNEPTSNLVDPAGYWQQKNPLNRGFFANEAVRANATIDTSNSINVIPVTSTTTTADESLAIARINDKGNFDFDDFPDSQDGDFRPTVSSICSYDDDIGYENYIDNSLVNNNSLPKTSNFELLRSLKAEARLSCDGKTNYSEHNVNDPRRKDANSLYYDFGSKEKVAESSDCIILENSPRA